MRDPRNEVGKDEELASPCETAKTQSIKRYELLRLSKTEYPIQICTEESANAVSSLNNA